MIALTPLEKHSLQEGFPGHCLKATPDCEFLSNLYDCDISMCPHKTWVAMTRRIPQIFMELLGSIPSSNSFEQQGS